MEETTAVEVLTKEQAQALERIDSRGTEALEIAEGLQVTNANDQAAAVDMARGLRQDIAKVEEWFLPLIKPQRQALDALYARRREAIEPRTQAIKVVERKVTSYRRQIAAQAAAAERKERERREAEAKAAREAAFDEAMEAGDTQRAEAIAEHVSAPVAAPPVAQEIVEREAPKEKGMAETRTWKARPETGISEGEAKKLLCAAVAAGEAPTTYVEIHWPTLHQVAKATKGELPVPGIEFYEDIKTQIRR